MADPANMTFPGDANNPGDAPTFTEGDRTNHATWVAEQLKWEKASKTKKDKKTMDQCLVTQLLSLIEPLSKANYDYKQMRDPNKPYRDVLQSFIRRYGTSTEAERKANRDRMSADWALTDGFEALEIRINEALEYADIAGQPITESEAIDAGTSQDRAVRVGVRRMERPCRRPKIMGALQDVGQGQGNTQEEHTASSRTVRLRYGSSRGCRQHRKFRGEFQRCPQCHSTNHRRPDTAAPTTSNASTSTATAGREHQHDDAANEHAAAAEAPKHQQQQQQQLQQQAIYRRKDPQRNA